MLELDLFDDPGFTNPDAITHLVGSGDYNNDGFKDLLFGYNFSDNEVFIALGQGGDQFEVVGPLIPVEDYIGIAVGDIEGDGVVEVVLREGFEEEIMIISGDTGITEFEFIPAIRYWDLDFFDQFLPMVVGGDIDDDGGSDFVLNTTNQRLFVRWSSRSQSDRYEEVLIPEIIEENLIYPLEDYDGDGDLDILVFDEDSARFILVEGSGGNTMGDYRVLKDSYPRIVVGDRPLFGQFDDDPAVDMVVHNSQLGSAEIVLNFVTRGAAVVDITPGEWIVPIGIEGDLDGSGFTDLVVLRRLDSQVIQGALLVDPVKGGSTLVPMVFGVPVDSVDLFPETVPIPRLDSMDIDEDGDQDLIWFGILGNQVRVTLNRTGIEGVPQFGASSIRSRPGPLHVLIADLDGDSFDEAIVTGESLARVYDLSDGTWEQISGSANAFMSALADLDNDGSQELVIMIRDDPQIKVYDILSDGTIGEQVVFTSPDGTEYLTAVVGDFVPGGGDEVIASSNAGGAIHILRGNDGAGLEFWGSIVDFSGGDVIKPTAIDFNNDGFLDLAIGDRGSDQIVFYANNGDGTFSVSHSIASPNPYWLIAADIDLDGVVDIASVNQDAATRVYFLDAAGQNEQSIELFGGITLVEVVAEDIVGDQLLDLTGAPAVQGGGGSGAPLVWEQVSPRVFEIVAVLPSSDTTGIAASDVNSDGGMDIVTVSRADRSVLVHWGSPDLCPADLTGDGRLDFFDISEFLQALPDYNNDGGFDFFDVSAFLLDFSEGCP